MTPAHIDNPACLSNSFTYAFQDLVSKAPLFVKEYANRNWIEIYMRRQEYYKQKRSPLLPPESIEDVSFTCRYLLSNMGTNSWLVQQKRDGSEKATSARMSAMALMPRKESNTTNKRKKKDTSKSIKLAPAPQKKRKKKKCSFNGCTKDVLARGFCYTHDQVGQEKYKKNRKRCSAEGCTNFVVNGGVCTRHGAKVKLCSSQGCTNQAQNGGVCKQHGAKVKLCSRDGCTNIVVKGGVCSRHGDGNC